MFMFIVVYRTRIPYTHRESNLEVSAAPHRCTLSCLTNPVPAAESVPALKGDGGPSRQSQTYDKPQLQLRTSRSKFIPRISTT